MDALWNAEDKLNLTTQKAVAVFACTFLLVILVVFLAAALRRKGFIAKKGSVIHQEPCAGNEATLSRAVRWSGATKWEEGSSPQIELATPTPLIAKRDGEDNADNVGWQSHNSTSAVWKRPILMGEKCEFPRFSGLILYDERGVPRHECGGGGSLHEQETSAASVGATLRDLLLH